MAKKKNNNSNPLLTNKQVSELQSLVDSMISLAKDIKEDYEEELAESNVSSSIDEIVQIQENSPFLDEMFKGDSWKKVMTNLSALTEKPKKDKKDDTE